MNPSGFACPRRIGFLFPHGCGRLTPIGCPDCQNGQLQDPYKERTDRDGYDADFDDYDSSSYESAGVSGPVEDFNEGDGETLVRTEEEEFEDDFSES